MWRDEDVVLLSALEHYAYCPRQFGLIYLERVYDENLFTLRGSQLHQRVHSGEVSSAPEGVTVRRAVPLWSDRLGLYGVADSVEFGPDGAPYPVEYKHGPRRRTRHDDLQLCAQALCLEEMLGREVPAGAVFSLQSRRRREVLFDAALRADTEEATLQIRELMRSGRMPPPVDDRRCPNCSLNDACVPGVLALARSVPEDLFTLAAEERLELAFGNPGG